MSTPHEYDPQKPPWAWADGLDAENPWAISQEHRKVFESFVTRIARLDAAARLVVAAGRPHEVVRPLAQWCRCSKCVAYDALADLLKDTQRPHNQPTKP